MTTDQWNVRVFFSLLIAIEVCRQMNKPIGRKLVVTVALLVGMIGAMGHPSPAQGSWYYTVTPPSAGPSFVVGYYNSELGCKDWLGSAIYLHPKVCHNHPTGYNCRVIGNGYAYPNHWPFPAADITSGTCFNSGTHTSKNRYWFYWYDSNGGTKAGGTSDGGHCEAVRQQYLRSNRPGEAGSGCFFIGNTGE
jgi:hypothetical protein